MAKLTLYGIYGSPPVRAVLLTLEALNLPYEFKEVDVLKRENLAPAYIKINPQHTVPTLEDDGNYLWDSHAIMCYLVEKYGKTDDLYPKDLLKRAVVDQRLFFEAGVVFAGALVNIMRPLIRYKENHIMPAKIEPITEAFDFLEIFLHDSIYMAGNKLTIADFSLITTVTTLRIFKQINECKYPNLNAWIERMQQLPYYAATNGRGLEMSIALVEASSATVIS